MSQELEKFSQQVIEIMPFIVREFAKREDNDLTRGKISCSQMVALDYLLHHNRVPMAEMAKVLSIKTSSASILIDRLIREKMLKRERDNKDRRVVWVSITPKGKKVVKQILSQKKLALRDIFRPLTPAERQQYLSVLTKVKAHIVGDEKAAG
jgi:DNA-binding MarR family transcriptional regulator